jgi:hypothetical protein
MGLLSRFRKKCVPLTIKAWDSDIIETHKQGKIHYHVQTIVGLKQLLHYVEMEHGTGGAILSWHTGNHFTTSAYIPLDVLIKLKGETEISNEDKEQ